MRTGDTDAARPEVPAASGSDARRKRVAICQLAVAMTAGAIPAVMHYLRAPDLSDLSMEEAPFGKMRMPPRHVEAWLAGNGYDVALLVRDAEGTDFEFTFPYHKSGSHATCYQRGFHTSAYSNHKEPVPFKDPARAKEVCIQILRGQPEEDFMYHQLSETQPSRFMDNLRKYIPRF